MERITDGRIYSEEISDEFVSVVKRSLLEYITLHRKAGKHFEYRPVDEVIEYLLENTHQALIEEQYLLIYTIEDCFFSYDRNLSEFCLMRIAEGNASMKTVMACIKTIAEAYGCNRVQLSTLAQEGTALSRLYQRYGFREQSRTLVRDI